PFSNPSSHGVISVYKLTDANYIDRRWVYPVKGKYFENPTPITGQTFCEVGRGTDEDIEAALDAAHTAAKTRNNSSPTERGALLLAIADRMEENHKAIAVAEA